MKYKPVVCLCVICVIGFGLIARGQWMSENIVLQSGWNSISFPLQPEPSNCELLFAGLPVEAVHLWDRSKGGIEFDSDPQNAVLVPPSWLVWRPTSNPQSFLNDFSEVMAGESYLIKVTSNTTFSVTGRAVITAPRWFTNAYNLVGLPVSGSMPSTFAEFFAGTSDIGTIDADGGAIYEILANGSERKVFQPALVDVKRGTAYWVLTKQVVVYPGPVEVSISGGASSLDYGSLSSLRSLKIKNITGSTRRVTLKTLSSGAPPQVGGTNLFPCAEGGVPLSHEQMNWDTLKLSYLPLPATLSSNIPPNSVWELKLVPRSLEMESPNLDAVWESILKISDDEGAVEQFIGVSCKGNAETFVDPAGLWVGGVVVDKVSRMAAGDVVSWDPSEPVDASDGFSFRVILHVDENGEVRLLQRALLAWNPSGQVVTGAGVYTNGIYALLADEADAETYQAQHPDSKIVRISSVNLPLMDPLLMNGAFGGDNTLLGTVTLPFNNPVNPFLHRYSPLHDNLEYRNDQPLALAEGRESFTVSRNLSFEFLEEDPDQGSANPQWGVSVMGGVFREEVAGLSASIGSARKIYVQGRFQVKKINSVGRIE
jgi:hypothetical protein